MTSTAQAELQSALAPGSLICLDTNCLLYYFKGQMPWTESLRPVFDAKDSGDKSVGVHPEMVDFGSEQGLSDFETAGIAGYFEDFKKAKTQLWAKRCRFRMGTS